MKNKIYFKMLHRFYMAKRMTRSETKARKEIVYYANLATI